MSSHLIGFIYYLSERNCPIDKNDYQAYAKWISQMYVKYCAKYPNGLTNGDIKIF